MSQASANVNIMIKAARKAARGLLRDFGEVEQLQVSAKGPGDFVSKADLKAEQSIRTDLTEARPNYGWLGEEAARRRGRIRRGAGWWTLWTERRTSCTAPRTGRCRSGWSTRARSSPG